MKTLLPLLCLAFAGVSFGGNGSGAGGGPVVFQASLLREVLSDSTFITSFDSAAKAYIASIERLHADKGVSTYRITSNGGCDIKIISDCANAMGGSDCKFTYEKWQCP